MQTGRTSHSDFFKRSFMARRLKEFCELAVNVTAPADQAFEKDREGLAVGAAADAEFETVVPAHTGVGLELDFGGGGHAKSPSQYPSHPPSSFPQCPSLSID